ncbi:nucleoid-associated protein [Segatella copri]|uniref:Nucleoid-associated protein n=1 Tax=Segatella copri TaxID=165179 RepID=A0AAW5UNT3_9BACT|nr:nucleoid-associated protein [Segatella copri]MCW4110191.1 nucleoid-associated protein [Segatella copri]MCW4120393.1 nucleoid-associated protein [Segatella copri]MCW4154165.1 nucleoid-associated protein [Segatella copri]
MIYTEYVKILDIIIHQVGNKLSMDGVKLSNHCIDVTDDLNELLVKHFLTPFRERPSLQFKSPLQNNSVYSLIKEMFANKADFIHLSQDLAKLLYENSVYSKIMNGEFYVVYFSNCVVDGKTSDAVGLFKTEQKTPYLRVTPVDDSYTIAEEQGFSLKHFEKACLIFNEDEDDGYQIAVIDKANKVPESQYWSDSFLQVKKRKTNSSQTECLFEMCKSFVSQLDDKDEVQKASMMNKALSILNDSETSIVLDKFKEDVFGDQDVSGSFDDFRKVKQTETQYELDEKFESDNSSLKKTGLKKLTTIHLDDNYDVVIRGTNDIEKGYDEKRQKRFYKLFYDKEK